MEVIDFDKKVSEASALLKMMGSEVRLQILCNIIDKKLTVGELNALIDISQSALSQHLAKLRADSLVIAERDGLNIYYSVSNPVVLDILIVLKKAFCSPN